MCVLRIRQYGAADREMLSFYLTRPPEAMGRAPQVCAGIPGRALEALKRRCRVIDLCRFSS